MPLFKWIAFLLYLSALSWEDIRKRSLSLPLLSAGCLTGMMFFLSALMKKEITLPNYGKIYLSGILIGALLCLISRLARDAVGKGDGLCLITFSFWWDFGTVLSMLLGGLCFLAIFGLAAGILRGGVRNRSYPFMPFLGAAGLLHFILMLIRPF